jgi:4-nitrophenyl phosphatase
MASLKTFNTVKLRGLILDMDGVLWRNNVPLGNLPAIFSTIDLLGLRVVMATNNATRSPQQYVEKLNGFGVVVESWQVINSATATAHYLKGRFPKGGNVFVVGEPALVEILAEEGFTHGGNDPVAVVAALDRGITYEKITEATLLIRNGVPFIGTNPDRSFPIPEGQAPGAGSILAALEAATDVSPTIIGKPQPDMYNVALERLGTPPEMTLVVGDRLETDVLGAQNAGCPCALVLSGVTTLAAAQNWQPMPDLIANDLTKLLELLIRDIDK